ARPALGGKQRRHRPRVGRIRPKAVHGLGRKRDQFAPPQRRRGGGNRFHAGFCGAHRRGSLLVNSSGPAPFRPKLPFASRAGPSYARSKREIAMTYQAPVDDILYALKTAADLDGLIKAGVLGAVDEDTVRAVIEEAGKFGSAVLDPLSALGDRTGCRLLEGR